MALAPEPLFACGARRTRLFPGGALLQSIPHEKDELLNSLLSVLPLAAGYSTDNVKSPAIIDPGSQPFTNPVTLICRELGAPGHIKQQLNLRLYLVDMLTARATAARGAK